MTGGLALWQSVEPAWATLLLLLIAAGFTLTQFSGDRTAQHVGALVLFATCLDFVVAVMPQHAAGRLPAADHSGIDVLYLGMLTTLCLRTPLLYPLVLAAAQLLVVITQALIMMRLLPGLPIARHLLAAPTALILLGLLYAAARAQILEKLRPRG